MKTLPFTVLALAVATLSACAPGHPTRSDGRFDGPGAGSGERRGPRPRGGEPLVERTATTNQAEIVATRLKRGFLEAGRVRYERKDDRNDARAIEQAKASGADLVVIVDARYVAPAAGARAVPATDQAASPVPAVTGLEHQGAYTALYFVRHDFTLGALARDLTDQERHDTATAQGAIIDTVVDDSPASRAGILPGDVVRAVDGVPVENLWRYNDLVDRLGGPEATLDLVRQGQSLQRTVKLAEPAPAQALAPDYDSDDRRPGTRSRR